MHGNHRKIIQRLSNLWLLKYFQDDPLTEWPDVGPDVGPDFPEKSGHSGFENIQ